MLDIAKDQNRTTHLYMEVYEYYKKLILDRKMAPGSKMPSLRKCSQELKLSRTTIETGLSAACRRRLYYGKGPERLLRNGDHISPPYEQSAGQTG